MKKLTNFLVQKLYPQALKASFSLQNPLLTNSIFAQFLKSNSTLPPFLSTFLITHFSLSGRLPFAAFLLRLTRKPDTAVFNSLISAYARVEKPGPAFELFNELCQLGLNPDVYSLSGLIKSCGDLGENEIAHGVSIKLGLNSDAFSVSGLIENYSKSGFVERAERCFGECLDLDAVVLTAMINAYVSNGEFEKGREVFMQMRCLGLCLNEFSLTSVIGALFDVKEGEQIHGFSLKIGFLSGCSIHLNNAVMNMYCRLGAKFDAVNVFDEIPNPDVISWTGRIGATDDVVEAFEIFELCRFNDLEINEYTLSNVLSVITNLKILNCGKQIHALCCKGGHLFIVSVCNSLILMYGKCGITDGANCVFDEMIYHDPVTWNSMIAGYSENGLYSEAVSVFSQMTEFSVQPNKYTIASILDVVSNSNSQNQTMQMHSLVIKYGFESDDSMLSSLITSYGKCNGINESKRVFSEIYKPKVTLLNAMSATFLHSNCHFDALELFKNSLSLSLEVDNITFSMALKACGVLTSLEVGRAIHSMALKSGFHEEIFVESSIIDAYCKCGAIDEAEMFFRYVSKGNIVALNAMLMGYAQRGCYSEVFYLFNKMSELGTWPDEITYLGVLTSCCNSGLVNEAQYYLSSMLEIHNVVPCLEHYACVIDVLGRVGFVEEAKRTIDRMSICPDAHIWQILLSACCMHGKVDLGIFAGKELIKLQPDSDSAYVLMSNLYASAGMWDDVRSLRKEMKERVIHKEAGSSWIQVKDSTRYFVAGEVLDSDNKEILVMVKRLRNEMLRPLDLEQDINVQICSLL